jgi:hypothetical protein
MSEGCEYCGVKSNYGMSLNECPTCEKYYCDDCIEKHMKKHIPINDKIHKVK